MHDKQIFQCAHCGNVVKSVTVDDCDQLEGARCDGCDFGHYQWTGPAEAQPASGGQLLDDVDSEVDSLFDNIILEES